MRTHITLALVAVVLAACGGARSSLSPASPTGTAPVASASSVSSGSPAASATASASTPASATAPAPSAPASASASAPAGDAIPVEVLDFKIVPAALTAPAGTVSFAVTNTGPTVHNVWIRDGAGKVLFGTRDLREGEADTATGVLASGEYVTFCTLPGHESLGTKGTLTVTP